MTVLVVLADPCAGEGIFVTTSVQGSEGAYTRAETDRGSAVIIAGSEVGEHVDLLEREPVFEAFLPHRGAAVDLATREAFANLLLGQRTYGLAVDREVPASVAAALLVVASRVCLVTNDDYVAALLAANLERLAADLLVRDRVLGSALIAFDLHQCASCAWVLHAALAPRRTHSFAGRPV